jgi:DNA repair ATPase RecN
MCMENNLNIPDAPVTKDGLKAEIVKLEEKMEQLLSEQANVILEAVGETMEKKLDEKFDPVITKLDGIMKGVEALQQENTVGAEQLRRHEDQLQKHEARIAQLETAPA